MPKPFTKSDVEALVAATSPAEVEGMLADHGYPVEGAPEKPAVAVKESGPDPKPDDGAQKPEPGKNPFATASDGEDDSGDDYKTMRAKALRKGAKDAGAELDF